MAAVVAKEKWKTNVPSLPDVLKAWVSPLKAAIEDDEGCPQVSGGATVEGDRF